MRWLSRDPVGEGGGINLYQFVANNPLVFIDALGENPLVVPLAGGAGKILVSAGFTAWFVDMISRMGRGFDAPNGAELGHGNNKRPSNWDKHSDAHSSRTGSKKKLKYRQPQKKRK